MTDIRAACAAHGVEVCMTRADHPSGTDRIAEVARTLDLPPDAVVVNLQGDEPLIDPALLAACAAQISAAVPMATCAHPLHDVADAFNPNVVKVVLDKHGRALYFSRATIPWHRDGFAQSQDSLPAGYVPLRHIGLYAYSNAFLQTYPGLCRVAAGSDRGAGAVARAVAWRMPSPCMSRTRRRPPVSIRRKILPGCKPTTAPCKRYPQNGRHANIILCACSKNHISKRALR